MTRKPLPLDPLYQGESRTVLITVTDEDTGLRKTLTGVTDIEFTVKSKIGELDYDGMLLKTYTDDGGITLRDQDADDTKGQALVQFDPDDTKTLAPGTYYYDVVVIWADTTRSVVVVPSAFPIKPVVNQA